MTVSLRARLGARWCVVILLLPLVLFGVLRFGPRAAQVLGLSTGLCIVTGILPRLIAGQPFRWFNPGSLITGLLVGLTVTADIPFYMVVVGALVGETVGKISLPGLGRNLFNPAAFGRGAIAILEYLDPKPASGPDALTSASPLMTAAGGHSRPTNFDMLFGFTEGAIGETSTLLLALVGVAMLGWVVLKREAALSTLLAVPLVVLCLPASAQVVGHAPWALNPAVYLLGSSYLLIAIFYATDPVTTPQTKLGGVVFGLGTAILGVAGRFYYSIPGSEMMAVLVMNLLTPSLDRMFAGQVTETHSSEATNPSASFYLEPGVQGRAAEVLPHSCLELILAGSQCEPFRLCRNLFSRPVEELTELVRTSGLSGCGGAYFPVASKWEAARTYPGPRTLIVNAQEGEPGTFKDRYLMLHHPRLVVAGAMLAARAVEAELVVVVVDPQWECGRLALEEAFAEMCLLIGEPPLDWRTTPGPGLYVCGEESALIEFLEGRRGEPQLRPPYPVERGLGGLPTVVHNVETLAWLPSVLGGFPGAGKRKLVSLTGAVKRPGLYEVETGAALTSILDKAGGMADGQTLKAFAVGGPSGGYLPPELGQLPFERGALAKAGAMLGAGSLEVIPESKCLVEHTLPTCTFFRQETCGRCSPCRVGTGEVERLWRLLLEGKADQRTLEQLREVAEVMQFASTCGLGKGAPTRILSVLRYWPGEAEAYLKSGKERVPCLNSL